MPKNKNSLSLSLGVSKNDDSEPGLGLDSVTVSPRSAGSPRTPRSGPSSSHLQMGAPASTLPQSSFSQDGKSTSTQRRGPKSPSMTAMPEIPVSPGPESPKHARDPSKSFFSNLMASKSSHKLHNPEQTVIETPENIQGRSRASSKDRVLHSIKKQSSTPELPKYTNHHGGGTNTHLPASQDSSRAFSHTHTHSESAPPTATASKKPKSKLGGILTRTKTIKLEDGTKQRANLPSNLHVEGHGGTNDQVEAPLKTAPVRSDHREKIFGHDLGSAVRNRSADRQSHEDGQLSRKDRHPGNVPASHSFRDGATLHLLSNIQQTGKGVGDRLGKAGNRFFGKITRSGSSNERETITDESYVCEKINLPLVQQTRITRIARRLELSKDKTEFWMPALPWRCIDYLNMNGCEEEGLYRIPGSGKDVKHWQRRFDTELDINLFDEPDLYDINTIGSMFKSWLRELPDEILPKSVQNKIAQQCAGATRTPQLFKDELSRLPPFNYYLLFAITCHLSLLNSFADKNKMDYRNLCICFQPCLKIDVFCFQFLVMDWKNCWQGCWTEKEYLEEEYRYEREGSHNDSEDLAVDDRAISSSGSSQHLPGPPKSSSTEGGTQRKPSAGKSNQRSLSSTTDAKTKINHSHTQVQNVPSAPRLVTTPEPQKIPETHLPELEGLSPIRM